LATRTPGITPRCWTHVAHLTVVALVGFPLAMMLHRTTTAPPGQVKRDGEEFPRDRLKCVALFLQLMADTFPMLALVVWFLTQDSSQAQWTTRKSSMAISSPASPSGYT
jgi:hypothetical protein